jgi:hypothetical protein
LHRPGPALRRSSTFSATVLALYLIFGFGGLLAIWAIENQRKVSRGAGSPRPNRSPSDLRSLAFISRATVGKLATVHGSVLAI